MNIRTVSIFANADYDIVSDRETSAHDGPTNAMLRENPG